MLSFLSEQAAKKIIKGRKNNFILKFINKFSDSFNSIEKNQDFY